MLDTPYVIGNLEVRNRLYRAPVLEGAGSGPDAVDRYAKAFVPNAEAGVGLIIQGSSCIAEEGRTSPGMTIVDRRDRVLALAPMVDAIHRAGAAIALQIGHGGLYAMEGWHEPYATERRAPLLAPSRPPAMVRAGLAGVPIHVLGDDEIDEICRQHGRVAGWAREAGYDAIQIGSANAKLVDQFLSPFYNRRRGRYGGSVAARFEVLAQIRREVARHAGADYGCWVKIPFEKSPPGTAHNSFDDAVEMCRLAEAAGFDAITPVEVSVLPDTTLSRGRIPQTLWRNKAVARRFAAAAPTRRRRAVIGAGYVVGGVGAPFRPVWNRPVIEAARRVVSIPVFAVGGIRHPAEAQDLLRSGVADMVGVGRPFYAEADLAARFLGDAATGADGSARCVSSNLCVPPQMLGMKGVCYNPDVRASTASSVRISRPSR